VAWFAGKADAGGAQIMIVKGNADTIPRKVRGSLSSIFDFSNRRLFWGGNRSKCNILHGTEGNAPDPTGLKQ